MILLLDTTSPTCFLNFVDGDWLVSAEWKADRELAKGLLGYIESELQKHQRTFSQLHGIGVLKGPGSFTGIRIGLTVANTLADALHIPIVGETGGGWRQTAIDRLNSGENDRITLPFYGSDAKITMPRK